MSEQCKGVTKSGTQCKISRNLTDGYCHLHLNQREFKEKVKEDAVEPLKESSEDVNLPDLQIAQEKFEEPQIHQNAINKEGLPKSEQRLIFAAVSLVVLAFIYSFFHKRR